jgi:hypothetical protein
MGAAIQSQKLAFSVSLLVCHLCGKQKIYNEIRKFKELKMCKLKMEIYEIGSAKQMVVEKCT